MRLLEGLYRSPLGRGMSVVGHWLSILQKPFMVYGYRDPASGRFRKYTRMSSNVIIMSKQNLKLGDYVWVWHHSILDATEGITIGEGCQIGAWVGIFTHGSESAIRLLGPRFVHIHSSARSGYTRGRVAIGAYTFVGAGSVILPGVEIGRGCLIAAGTLVARDVPDHSVVVGWPGEVRGSTVAMDRRKFAECDYSDTYYDKGVLSEVLRNVDEP
jgi:acetyltransferase-like isoleucine patch superfamily enzyme